MCRPRTRCSTGRSTNCGADIFGSRDPFRGTARPKVVTFEVSAPEVVSGRRRLPNRKRNVVTRSDPAACTAPLPQCASGTRPADSDSARRLNSPRDGCRLRLRLKVETDRIAAAPQRLGRSAWHGVQPGFAGLALKTYGCGYFGTTVRHRNFALDKLAPISGEEGIGVLSRRGALRPALLRRHPATRGCQSLLQRLRHRDRSECRSQRLSQNISW
jgi:hypothetical protein